MLKPQFYGMVVSLILLNSLLVLDKEVYLVQFFAVDVDDLLNNLSNVKIGCFINGHCLNSIMYADDLVLIAISISDLRKLIDICISFFDSIDMPINLSKSKCMRIGARFKCYCAPIVINNSTLSWTKSMKFLGFLSMQVKTLNSIRMKDARNLLVHSMQFMAESVVKTTLVH
jgi:hypothetical protein